MPILTRWGLLIYRRATLVTTTWMRTIWRTSALRIEEIFKVADSSYLTVVMDNSEPSKLRVSPLLNSSHFVVLGLFTGVTNAPVVRERLVDGTLKAAVIDCRLVGL